MRVVLPANGDWPARGRQSNQFELHRWRDRRVGLSPGSRGRCERGRQSVESNEQSTRFSVWGCHVTSGIGKSRVRICTQTNTCTQTNKK